MCFLPHSQWKVTEAPTNPLPAEDVDVRARRKLQKAGRGRWGHFEWHAWETWHFSLSASHSERLKRCFLALSCCRVAGGRAAPEGAFVWLQNCAWMSRREWGRPSGFVCECAWGSVSWLKGDETSRHVEDESAFVTMIVGVCAASEGMPGAGKIRHNGDRQRGGQWNW